MKRKLSIGIVALLFSCGADMVSAQEIITLQHDWLCDMWFFSYSYPSVSATGDPVTLTALACVPEGGTEVEHINNVILGCHATITSNEQCPSEFGNSGILNSDVYALMYHAGSGLEVKNPQSDLSYHNLVIVPDYEGYGATVDHAHPYLCEEITARQVTDAARYGIQLYQNDAKLADLRHPFRDDWRTICIGYSQGGAVAMATQRYIEQNQFTDELHLSGAICGDGPYDPLTTLLFYIGNDQADEVMEMPVVMPLMLKGLCDYSPLMTGHEVSDYLQEHFLETGVIDWITSKEMTTEEITIAWRLLYALGKDGDHNYYRDLLTENGKMRLRDILKPEAYDYFLQILDTNPDYATQPVIAPEGEGLMKDLYLALQSNNLTIDWQPEHPVCLYHSIEDEVVPIHNYQRAKAAFGDRVTFYESKANGNHLDTGNEFYTGATLEDCIREFATLPYQTTGIRSIVQSDDDTYWYDLSGRRLAGKPTQRGIYIRNGRKIIIR